MKEYLVNKFIHFLGRFTYRQRFVFLVFIFVVVSIPPNYWIFTSLYLQRRGIERQLQEIQGTKTLRYQELPDKNAIAESFAEKKLLELNLQDKLNTNNWLLGIAFVGLFIVSFISAFYLYFRVLTKHLLRLLDYIQGLTKGDFSLPIQVDKHDEVGMISIAFYKMGGVIESIALQLKNLNRNLVSLSSNIKAAADLQRTAVTNQEKSLNTLENTLAIIRPKSRELGDAMGSFTQDSKQRFQENAQRERLNAMQANMATLTDASTDVLNILTHLQETVLGTHFLIDFMTKISDQIHQLYINASIETLNSSEHYRVIFDDITLQIQRFADATYESTSAIKKIISDMTQGVLTGKKTAEGCLNEIGAGGSRLLIVEDQLFQIGEQGEEQIIEFYIVNEIMQAVVDETDKMIGSLSRLNGKISESSNSVAGLDGAVTELGAATQELQSMLQMLSGGKFRGKDER